MPTLKDEPLKNDCPLRPDCSLRADTTNLTLERSGTTTVIKNVPAVVCETCEKTHVDQDVIEEAYQQTKGSDEAGGDAEIQPFVPYRAIEDATESEILRSRIDRYANLDLWELRAIRDESKTTVEAHSYSKEAVLELPSVILTSLVATTILTDLKKKDGDVDPWQYNFQKLIEPRLQRRVSIAQELIPDLSEEEKKVTVLCKKIADVETGAAVTENAIRQNFREAGYEGKAQGQGARKKNFQELVELVNFAARVGAMKLM